MNILVIGLWGNVGIVMDVYTKVFFRGYELKIGTVWDNDNFRWMM